MIAQPTYNAVVMYPPHRRDLAVQHVVHAYRFLRPGGVLTALVSPGLQNAAGKRGDQFRQLLSRAGYLRPLDEADFVDGYLLSPTGLRLSAQLVHPLRRRRGDGPRTAVVPSRSLPGPALACGAGGAPAPCPVLRI